MVLFPEAIKWPELNREHVGGSTTDGLSREVSNYSSGALSRDVASEHLDPYAVPPLPQFNPNQPYRDDPYAASNAGYYDPYRGPVPQTLHDDPMEGHENIPMNAYPSGTRTRSPGPAMSLDMGGRGSPAPGPGLAYNAGPSGPGRTMSPAASTLGMDRRASPGPQYALGGQP
ncbi:hypothetical protein BU17DRAFT_41080 [Hysterangium stoloniferum]|nr:hypothetical protein BU17DRAFT_41080 [Hysterangium stoloniferum]